MVKLFEYRGRKTGNERAVIVVDEFLCLVEGNGAMPPLKEDGMNIYISVKKRGGQREIHKNWTVAAQG